MRTLVVVLVLSSCAPHPPGRQRHIALVTDASPPADASIPQPDARVADASPPAPVDLSTPELRALDRFVREADMEGIDLATRLGAAAVPLLLERLRDPERRARHAAVVFLSYVDGPGATEGLIEATTDADRATSLAAARSLPGRVRPTHLPRLIELMRSASEDRVRGGLAMAIGRLGGDDALREVRSQRQREKAPETLKDFDLALAYLGDLAARERFIARLTAADDAPDRWEQERAFEDLDYLGAPWLLPTLLTLLDDRTVLNVLAPSGQYDDRQVTQFRVCDYAIPAIEAITGHDFKFKKRPHRPYTAAQVAAARKFLRQYLAATPP